MEWPCKKLSPLEINANIRRVSFLPEIWKFEGLSRQPGVRLTSGIKDLARSLFIDFHLCIFLIFFHFGLFFCTCMDINKTNTWKRQIQIQKQRHRQKQRQRLSVSKTQNMLHFRKAVGFESFCNNNKDTNTQTKTTTKFFKHPKKGGSSISNMAYPSKFQPNVFKCFSFILKQICTVSSFDLLWEFVREMRKRFI